MDRKVIATHHAPDLDAIGATWMLKRFDSQHYATAKVAFVDPGSTITAQEALEHDATLDEVTHVDTGLGEFDHHQPERGHQRISASSLVYDHVCKVHPDLKQDRALAELSAFITDIDHFGEINWPEAEHLRYALMIHELIRGIEFTDPHNDESQLHFGMTCLDSAYATLTLRIKAEEIIATEGTTFDLPFGACLALETSNDDTIKVAQKKGFSLVVRKDPKLGNIRIKLRPDTKADLKAVHEKVLLKDTKGSWYYHPSGKMLINGSRKHRNQTASPLKLTEITDIIKESFHA